MKDIGNVIIYGDSYSTFEGYIPEGYLCFYKKDKDGSGETDVHNVEETWWMRVLNKVKGNLISDDSYSGSTISYTGYDNCDCSMTSSFIPRLYKHIKEDYVKKDINTIFVCGGTNDSWADSPVGEVKFDNFTQKDLYSVLPAVSFFIKELKSYYKSSRIIFIINKGEIKEEIVKGINEVCKHFKIETVTIDDIDKKGGHPTIKGMKEISEKVLLIL